MTTYPIKRASIAVEALHTQAKSTHPEQPPQYKPCTAIVFIGSCKIVEELKKCRVSSKALVCMAAHDDAETYQWGKLHNKSVRVLADNIPSNLEIAQLCIELLRCGVRSVYANRLNGQFITSHAQGGY